MKQCVRLGQLSTAAPVILKKFGQFVVLLSGKSTELCSTHFNALQPGSQTSTGLPNTQLLQRERLQKKNAR